MWNKVKKSAFSIILCLTIITSLLAPWSVDYSYGESGNAARIFGLSAYDTSMEAVDEYMRLTGKAKLDAVILTTGKSYQDAISGSFLVNVVDAPILLIDPVNIKKGVDFISPRLDKEAKVIILGGPKALPEDLEKIFTARGFNNTQRIWGLTAIDTNMAILQNGDALCLEKKPLSDKLLVATANSYYDALSAGSLGLPIMLVGSELSSEQKGYLEKRSFSKITIIGGDKAVSKKVEDECKLYSSVDRVFGLTAFDTSIKIAEVFFANKSKEVVLACGEGFPDGLSSAAIAQNKKAPIILTGQSSPAQAYNYIKTFKIKEAVIIGGPAVIPKELVPLGEGGYPIGWSLVGSKYVYINPDGTMATGTFKDGTNTVTASANGLILPEYRQEFIWPVDGPLTSYFGYRPPWVTSYIGSTNHGGIDIGVGYYTPVKASKAGKVVKPTGWYLGYGYLVVLEHEGGMQTWYGHNSYLKVKVGQTVKQGDVIAASGSTGNSTGPHVHFEIRKNGTKVDPLEYLPVNKYYKK